MSSSQSSNLLIKEQLYDALGRAAFTTVNVLKKTSVGNLFTYCSQLGFASNFIKTRNPASTGIWAGGAIDGDIINWVDPTSYIPVDANYAYSGIYFESDPASRPMISTKPGDTFKKSSDHAITYDNNELSDEIKTSFSANLNISIDDMVAHYSMGGRQTSLGSLGKVTSGNMKDFSGQPIANIIFSTSTNYMLSANSYHLGAQLSSENPSVPIMSDNLNFLPNYYCPIPQPKNYYIKTQSNALGQIIYGYNPDENVTVYFYDKYGRLRFTQNADQKDEEIILYYLYDNLKRLTEVGILKNVWDISYFTANYYDDVATIVPVSSDKKYNGKPLRRFIFDRLPQAQNLDLNSQGRLVQLIHWNKQSPDSLNDSVNQISLSYSYDNLGRIMSVTTDTGNGNINVITYAYDSQNNITEINYPSGVNVFYAYNVQNQIATISYQASGAPIQVIAIYTYNANGFVLSEQLGIKNKIVRNYVYNNSLGQLTAISDSLFQEQLSYTDQDVSPQAGNYQDGNIQYLDCIFGQGIPVASYKIHYTYDVFNRLAMDNYPEYHAWSYDANGNITKRSDGSIYNLIPGTNKLDSISKQNNLANNSYQYSTNGLTTQTPDGKIFKYDPLIQLPAQITLVDSSNIDFIYDGKGERFQKIMSDSILTYIRGLSAWPLVEIATNSLTNDTNTLNYIYGPLGLVMINDSSDTGNNYFIGKDHLGSTRVVYNDSTNSVAAYYTYDSFGQLLESQSGGTEQKKFRYRYTGQEWDAEINLYNYHARQYDPAIGRFLTPDPAHQFASSYMYAGDNPVNNSDPLGKMIAPESMINNERIHAVIRAREGTIILTEKYAYKIYKDYEQILKVLSDSKEAEAKDIPIGNVCKFGAELLLDGERSTVHGIRSERAFGLFFQLSKPGGLKILSNEISKTSNRELLKIIIEGLEKAQAAGVRDPQGFININSNPPLRFIDIHMNKYSNEIFAGVINSAKEHLNKIENTMINE